MQDVILQQLVQETELVAAQQKLHEQHVPGTTTTARQAVWRHMCAAKHQTHNSQVTGTMYICKLRK